MVVTATVLEAPIPEKLTNIVGGGEGDALSYVKSLLRQLNSDVQAKVASLKEETVATVSQRAEHFCKTFADTLSSSFEGDHFVPLIGYESVKAFEQLSDWESICGNVEEELKTAWEVNDALYRETKQKGAKSIACAVADPSGVDCPLVYISPGFEDLTQYRRTWVLGRNCRFLQPNDRNKNKDINGEEVARMRTFCVESKNGQIINLLYNEAADGTHFWNLLYMAHIKCKGINHTNKRHYIFAVQTNIIVQHEILDTLILSMWGSGMGKKNWARLREMFQREEEAYAPKQTSLKRMGDLMISEWVNDIGRNYNGFWEGGSYVPLVGRPAVQEFSGQWPMLVEEAAAGIRSLFSMTDGVLGNMKTNTTDEVVCAVSDPTAVDCPLVFLSQGFENMTGYHKEFALGRNCRFLQPNIPEINKKINGNELGRMKGFCKEFDKKGLKMVNLLLNERKTGERFWNLLHMQHVVVQGRPYILAVQTILDMPMPLLIRDHDTTKSVFTYDKVWLTTFVDEMCVFLDQMRGQLQSEEITCMQDTANHASTSIVNFMRRHCGDFEGDHLVPRVGFETAYHFERDKTWKLILQRVQSLLVDIWDVSEYNDEEVACAVSDPDATDCPLVYVSQKFERMTGYTRDWVLGRNCRFLQPNDSKRNMFFNEEDKVRMRDFCSKEQPEGTRIINLLVNETKSGYPFWNLLVMEHVFINQKHYIFGVQTTLEIEAERLTEILTMDRDGISELSRLRHLFRAREKGLDKSGLKGVANDVLRKWSVDFPAYLEFPRFKMAGNDTSDAVYLPLAGLVLTPQQPLAELVHAGLEEGVRHFALALNSDEYLEDTKYVEKVSHLLSLRIAELLNQMRMKYLHYMRKGMIFTLITRPQYIHAFKGISKAMAASGYTFRCWLLDVRGIKTDKPLTNGAAEKLNQCWRIMSEAHKAGDVKTVGLYGPMGSITQAMQCLLRCNNLSPVSVLALDDYPSKEQDQSRLAKFQKLYVEDYGKPSLMTYGLYGPNNSLLQHKGIQEHAADLEVDVCTMLLKWAQTQGYGALVHKVKDTDLKVRNVDQVMPTYHRGLTRSFAEAASAKECSERVLMALRGIGKAEASSKVHTRARTRKTTLSASKFLSQPPSEMPLEPPPDVTNDIPARSTITSRGRFAPKRGSITTDDVVLCSELAASLGDAFDNLLAKGPRPNSSLAVDPPQGERPVRNGRRARTEAPDSLKEAAAAASTSASTSKAMSGSHVNFFGDAPAQSGLLFGTDGPRGSLLAKCVASYGSGPEDSPEQLPVISFARSEKDKACRTCAAYSRDKGGCQKGLGFTCWECGAHTEDSNASPECKQKEGAQTEITPTGMFTLFDPFSARSAPKKLPAVEDEQSLRAQRSELLLKKQQAIEDDDFEEAAKVRDALKSLDAKLQQLSSAPPVAEERKNAMKAPVLPQGKKPSGQRPVPSTASYSLMQKALGA